MTADTASCNLISYIAPAAPATRRRARGDEPFLRPEIGFTPKWFRENVPFDDGPIDFGEKWHTDPEYRRRTLIAAREELGLAQLAIIEDRQRGVHI